MSTKKLPREAMHTLEMQQMQQLLEALSDEAAKQAQKTRVDLEWNYVAMEHVINDTLAP